MTWMEEGGGLGFALEVVHEPWSISYACQVTWLVNASKPFGSLKCVTCPLLHTHVFPFHSCFILQQ